MTQHKALSEDRWREFSFDNQILMIGNEMNRARRLIRRDDRQKVNNCYERVLRLVDLTIGVQRGVPGRLRELLRWRDLIAQLYIEPNCNSEAHTDAFRCLLRFTPIASQQIPLLFAS